MKKTWLEHYPEGVPHSIDPNQYPSLNALLAEAMTQFKDRVCFRFWGSALTFAQVDALSHDISSYLCSLKLKKGSRIAIMLPNMLQYPITLLGILRAGCVVVNVNPLYTADELAHELNDAQAETIVVLAKYAPILRSALPKIPMLKHVIITEVGDLFPYLKRFVINTFVKIFINHRVTPPLRKAIHFRKALKMGRQHPHKFVRCRHDDLAFLQYTGGTTGVSKGAMLTHKNMIANILQTAAWISCKNFNKNDLVFTALPLYHIFSLTANCLLFFHFGIPNLLIIDPRNTKRLLQQIRRTPPSALAGVSTLFSSMLNHPDFRPEDFANIKIVLSGGMALNPAVAEHWRSRIGSPIVEAYGLTEASPAVAINPLNRELHQGSIGLPIPSTDVVIRDPEGNDCPIGVVGELCVRGPQVMLGYWRQTKETEAVFWPDHFLRTGDSAHIDEQGFIYLVDRLKEMIIVSGFNVYPNEVEHVIEQMPQVLEVGVIGVPSRSGNEIVKACVVSKDPRLTEKDVQDYCRKHLTGYKIPKIVSFYKELPKSNVGKILRRMLK